MFGFEKKPQNEEVRTMKVVFDMELLDRAFDAAIASYEETVKKTSLMMGIPHSEEKAILDQLETLKLRVFKEKVKEFLTELSEKEEEI